MTIIRRCAAVLVAVCAAFIAALAVASAAMAQVPLPDVNPVQRQAPVATQIVHDGAPTWLLIVVACGAIAVTLAGVAAAAKVHHPFMAVGAH